MVNQKDQIYQQYKAVTNMTCAELKKWKVDPCSKKASLSSEPLSRNIRLMCKRKSLWTKKDIEGAKRTINFIARNKNQKCGRPRSKDCPCGSVIAGKNWAFDRNKKK